jgi:hypothetical protein
VAVRARGGDDDDVAGGRRGQRRVGDEHVAGLAVAPDEANRLALVRPGVHAAGGVGLVAGAVEHRAQVVGHPAVDRDVGAHVALDRLHGVERDAAVGDEGAAGLVEDRHVAADELVDGGHLRRGVGAQRRR